MPQPEILLERVIHPFPAAGPATTQEDVGGAAPARSISFDLQAQRQDQWCWAAVAVSVSIHYDLTTLTQCRLASAVLNLPTCCQDETSCNQQAALSDALRETHNLAEGPIAPLEFGDVRDEIERDRLVCCRIERDGQGHFVVLSGYKQDLADEWVDVQDPFGDVTATYRYNDFLTRYQTTGRCTHAYLTE
jgi:papain like cysteine protease AvrRpt2